MSWALVCCGCVSLQYINHLWSWTMSNIVQLTAGCSPLFTCTPSTPAMSQSIINGMSDAVRVSASLSPPVSLAGACLILGIVAADRLLCVLFFDSTQLLGILTRVQEEG